MKVIIAGSRGITDYKIVARAVVESGYKITEVVSGGARGVDRLGERFASNHDLPVEKFPANWDRYGKSAGYRRNQDMACYADALVAVWDGKSRGTRNMIALANKHGLKVFVLLDDNTATINGL